MQKTKLGISAALLGAVICFSGLFGGYLLVFLLTACPFDGRKYLA